MMPIFNNCPTPSHFSPCTSTSELSSPIYVGAKLPASSSFFSSLIKALAAFCHKDVGICGVDLSPSDMCRLQPFCCSQDSLKRAYHTIRYHQPFQKVEDQGFLCPFSTGRAVSTCFNHGHTGCQHMYQYTVHTYNYYIIYWQPGCNHVNVMPSDMIAVKRSESYGPSVELLYTDTYSWPASLWSLMPIDDHREPALFDPKMAEKSSVKSEHMGQRRALHEPRIKSLEDHGLYMTLK